MELVPMAEFTIVTRSSSSSWIPELIAAVGAQDTETTATPIFDPRDELLV